MATPTVQDAVITIGADITKAVAAIQTLQKQLQAVAKGFAVLNVASLGGNAAGKSATQMNQAAQAANNFARGMRNVAVASGQAATQQENQALATRQQLQGIIAGFKELGKLRSLSLNQGSQFFQGVQKQLALGIDPKQQIADLRTYIKELDAFSARVRQLGPGQQLPSALAPQGPTRKDVFGPGAGGTPLTSKESASAIRRYQQDVAGLIKSEQLAVQGFQAMNNGVLKFGDLMRVAFASAKRDFDPITKQFRGASEDIGKLTGRTNQLDDSLRGLLKIPQQGGLFERLFGNFNESIKLSLSLLLRFQVARVILDGITAAAREFGGAAIKLQDNLAQIQAITGESSDAVNILGKEMRKFSSTSIVSLDEASKGLQVFAQAGYSSTQAVQALGGVMALAIGGVTSLEESTKLLTSTLQAFQLPASQADRVANTLVATANKSKTSIEELNVAFNYAGSSAALAGLSIEDLGALVGVLANNGIKASTQGTAIRQVISSLISPSTKAVEVFERLNINLADIDPRGRDIVEIFKHLRSAGFGTAEAFEAFDKRAGSAIATLVRQADAIGELRDKVTDTNAAFDAMNVRQQSVSAQATILFNKFREFAILMSRQFLPVLSAATSGLGKTFDVLNNSPFLRAIISGTLLAGFARFFGLFGVARGIFGGLGRTIAGVSTVWKASAIEGAAALGAMTRVVSGFRTELQAISRGLSEADAALILSQLRWASFGKVLASVVVAFKSAATWPAAFAASLNVLRLALIPLLPALGVIGAAVAVGTGISLFLSAQHEASEALARRLELQRAEAETTSENIRAYKAAQDALKETKKGTIEYVTALVDLQRASATLIQQFPDLAAGLDKVTGALSVSSEQLAKERLIGPIEKALDVVRQKISEIGASPLGLLSINSNLPKEAVALEKLLEIHIKETAELEKIKALQEEITNITVFGGQAEAATKITEVQERGRKAIEEAFAALPNVTEEKKQEFADAITLDPSILQSSQKIVEEAKKLYTGLSGDILLVFQESSRAVSAGINRSLSVVSARVQQAEALRSRLLAIGTESETEVRNQEKKLIEIQNKLDAQRAGLSPEQAARQLVERQAASDQLEISQSVDKIVSGYLQSIEQIKERKIARSTIQQFLEDAEGQAPEAAAAVMEALAAALAGTKPAEGLASLLTTALITAANKTKNTALAANTAGNIAKLDAELSGSKTNEALAKYQDLLAKIDADHLRALGLFEEAARRERDAALKRARITHKEDGQLAAEQQTINLQFEQDKKQAALDTIRFIETYQKKIEETERARLEARLAIAQKIADLQVQEAEKGRSGESISVAKRRAELVQVEAEIAKNLQDQRDAVIGVAKDTALLIEFEKERNRIGDQRITEAELEAQKTKDVGQAKIDQLQAESELLARQKTLVRNVGEVAVNIGDTIQTGIADAFEGIILQTSKLKDVAKNFGTSLLKSITGALAKSLVEKLGFDNAFIINMQGLGNATESILGRAFSAVFGTAGSLVGQFVSLAGGLFGRLAGGIGGVIGGVGSLISGGTAAASGGTTAGAGGFGGFLTSAGGFLGQASGAFSSPNFGAGFAQFADSNIGLGLGLIPAISTFGNFQKSSTFQKILSGVSLLRSLLGFAGKIPGLGVLGSLTSFGPGGLLGKLGGSLFPSLFGTGAGGVSTAGTVGFGGLENLFGLFGSGTPTAGTAGFVGIENALTGFGSLPGGISSGVAPGGAEAGAGVGNISSILGALTSIISLIYTGYQASQSFQNASKLSLGQKGPESALKGLAIGGPAVGAGAGALIGLAGGPIGVLVGAAIGAAIGQAISSAVQGALGSALSDTIKKGLSQKQLTQKVIDDLTLQILSGGIITLGDPDSFASKTLERVLPGPINDLVTGVVDDILRTLIPRIDKFFRGQAEKLIEKVTNLDIQNSQYQPRGALGPGASGRFDTFFGKTGAGGLTPDARLAAQFVLAGVGGGTENEHRIFQFINLIRNAIARGRQDIEGAQKAIYDIIRGVTSDKIIKSLELWQKVFRRTGSEAGAKDLINRAFQEIFPFADIEAVTDALLRSGALAASVEGKKASREAVGSAAGVFLETGTPDELLGKFAESLGQSLADAVTKTFVKFISSGRSPIGIALAKVFDDITKGISKALRRGLDEAGADALESKLTNDIAIAAQTIASFTPQLLYLSKLFKQLQEILEEALLTPEERQSQRVDFITKMLEQIGGAFSKMLGLILDRTKQVVSNIQRRTDLANLGEDEHPIAIAAVNAFQYGIESAFNEIRANLENMTLEQQQAALASFSGSVDEFISLAARQITEQFSKAIEIAKQAKSLFETVQKTILGTRLADPNATPQDKLGAIQKEIALQKDILLTGKPEDQLKAAQRLNELFPQLLQIAGDTLDQSGPEFASVKSAVDVGLSQLAAFLDAQGAKLIPLEEQQTTALQGIQSTVDRWLDFIEDNQSTLYTEMSDNTQRMITAITDLIVGDKSQGTNLKDILFNATLSQLKGFAESLTAIFTEGGLLIPPNDTGAGTGEGLGDVPASSNQNVIKKIKQGLAKSFGIEEGQVESIVFPTSEVFASFQEAFEKILAPLGDSPIATWLKTNTALITPEFLKLGPTLDFSQLGSVLNYMRELILKIIASAPEDIIQPDDPNSLWASFRDQAIAALGRNQVIKQLAHLAEGGIAFNSTLAHIGEAGPEAVIPLNAAGMGKFFSILRSAISGADSRTAGMARSVGGWGSSQEVNLSVAFNPGAIVINNAGGSEMGVIQRLPDTIVDRIAMEMKRGRLNRVVKEIAYRV